MSGVGVFKVDILLQIVFLILPIFVFTVCGQDSPQCGLNEELRRCGPICSCAELLETGSCADICGNNRCFCITGFVWDAKASNVCIPIGVCQANAKILTTGPRSPGPPAGDGEVPLAPAVDPRDLALSCKANEKLDICGTDCTCAEFMEKQNCIEACKNQTHCFCKDGYLRRSAINQTCVPIDVCIFSPQHPTGPPTNFTQSISPRIVSAVSGSESESENGPAAELVEIVPSLGDCRENEEKHMCGTDCTCLEFHQTKSCKNICPSGPAAPGVTPGVNSNCFCKTGLVRRSSTNNTCISLDECNTLVGSLEITEIPGIPNSPGAMHTQLAVSACTKHEERKQCAPECTCRQFRETASCPEVCSDPPLINCHCVEGYLREDVQNRTCIPIDLCMQTNHCYENEHQSKNCSNDLCPSLSMGDSKQNSTSEGASETCANRCKCNQGFSRYAGRCIAENQCPRKNPAKFMKRLLQVLFMMTEK